MRLNGPPRPIMETAAPAVRTEEKARTRYIDGEVTNVPVTNDRAFS